MAIINNVAYSWSMITLASTALGIDEGSTTLEGVSAIKWSKKRKVESNYGMGGKPVSRGFGNITYTASITMDYATQQLLRSVYGSLLEIGEFDLIISFANPKGYTLAQLNALQSIRHSGKGDTHFIKRRGYRRGFNKLLASATYDVQSQ